MKISYIIPVYKVEKYLRQCVDSILMQSLENCEIILVDDGSPDSCPLICDEYKEKFPDKISVIHKKNEGPAVARNLGIARAMGDYIFFVDSDDYLVGDSVKYLFEKAVEYNADVIHTSFFSLDEKSGEVHKSELSYDNDTVLDHKGVEREICFASSKNRISFPWRNMYRRDFLVKNKIHFAEELKMIEDGPFNMLAFTSAERFVAVDIPVYCYRIRDDSLQRKSYVPDYDEWLYKQWALKLKYYEQNCTVSPVFYEDIAEFTLKFILPLLLGNVYTNNIKDRYSILKRISSSKMIRKSFEDYDINKFKSKSLDWLMTYFIKNKMLLPAHILCEKVLYKSKR